MKPKIFLNERPCFEAQAILQEIFDLSENKDEKFSMVWTGKKEIQTSQPVACPCTGIDHIKTLSDVIYLDKKFKTTVGQRVTSTAEHTFLLILQMARRKKMQLANKTLGVVGLGRIGEMVAQYGLNFRMKVQAHDPYVSCETLQNLNYYSLDFEYNSNLISFYQDCDIITFHVPLNNDTRGMVDKDILSIVKDDVILINTSRQEIVNTFDISQSLKNNKIYYADDFQDSYDFYFNNYERCIQTPHIGGDTKEAREITDIYIANETIKYWRSKNP